MTNSSNPVRSKDDDRPIVIVGGGVIGSSVAYHLATNGNGADVRVVEPDPSYQFAATPRAVGTVRRVFGLTENIALSQYGHELYGDFSNRMAVAGEQPDIGSKRQGYLYMVWGSSAVAAAEAAWRMQHERRAPVQLIDAAAIQALFPSIAVGDVDAALWSPEDMWIDPHAALYGFRRKAMDLGVCYVQDRVVGLEVNHRRVTHARLESGSRLSLDQVVNCANCWAPDVCEMVGLRIPVEPMRRQTLYFDCRSELETMPITRDSSGLSFRPEGRGYIAGMTHQNRTPGIQLGRRRRLVRRHHLASPGPPHSGIRGGQGRPVLVRTLRPVRLGRQSNPRILP